MGSGFERSKSPMLSRPRNVSFLVLAVHPPGEVQEQLLENAGQERDVSLATAPGHLVDAPGGPGVNRRIHVAERELVRRNLPVRVHVPLAEQEHELLFGERAIGPGEGDHVEREIPSCKPRVLPLVGHRDDVPVVDVSPLLVARPRLGVGRPQQWRVALEPVPNRVVIELLRPQQARVGLPDDGPLGRRERGGARGVEGVGLRAAERQRGVEVGEGLAGADL